MANAVANAMTEDNMRKKAESEKLKDVLDELMKLDIPSGDVLHAGEIFAANKDKMDLFMNLSKPLRVSYVLKLMGLSSNPFWKSIYIVGRSRLKWANYKTILPTL